MHALQGDCIVCELHPGKAVSKRRTFCVEPWGAVNQSQAPRSQGRPVPSLQGALTAVHQPVWGNSRRGCHINPWGSTWDSHPGLRVNKGPSGSSPFSALDGTAPGARLCSPPLFVERAPVFKMGELNLLGHPALWRAAGHRRPSREAEVPETVPSPKSPKFHPIIRLDSGLRSES